MQGAIIYKGRYGATHDYAALLSKELGLPVSNETLTGGQLIHADYLFIGSAVYAGKFSLRNWLIRHQEWLKDKKLFFFIVCATPAEDKEKTAKLIADNIPVCLQQNSIFFLKGRLVVQRLSWIDRTVLRLGAALTKDPQQKKHMLQDFDGVHVSNLRPLIQAFKLWELAELEKKTAVFH